MLNISTYTERENGFSQLLHLLFSLLNPQLGALLDLTELPLTKIKNQKSCNRTEVDAFHSLLHYPDFLLHWACARTEVSCH